MENIQKPNIDKNSSIDQRQYKDDPLSEIIAKLRTEKKIPGATKYRNIPPNSRLAVSPSEIYEIIIPKIASRLNIKASAIRLPRAIEFNVIANTHHPEWGETNTWEWLDNKVKNYHLMTGSSNYGGISYVSMGWEGWHYDTFGFRLLIDPNNLESNDVTLKTSNQNLQKS